MKNFTATRLIAAASLVSFLALPALAAPSRQHDESREPAIIRIIKAAKRVFGISTAEYVTIPKP